MSSDRNGPAARDAAGEETSPGASAATAASSPREAVLREFTRRFGSAPEFLVRAPGRVNLIGEHTDYNDGFVMPMAIERAVWIALRARPDRRVQLGSLEYRQDAAFDLDSFARAGEGWLEYVKGTAFALAERGIELRGWEGIMSGDVPIGAGLSSSAALELATARAFVALAGGDWDPVAMALACQRAENHWVGVNCGIMDQMISATGQPDHAVLIDCRSLEPQPVPLPAGTVVVIMDTATRRGLVDSAYNERRRQCEDAARFFGVRALRDVTMPKFAAREHELSADTRRRARHVISENERTVAAAAAMRAGRAEELGLLMNDSHTSLRDDFEVSSPELDAMVEIARAQTGCFGARMTGAGFGGCAVALVAREAVEDFVARVAAQYTAETGHTPQLYVTGATAGASVSAGAPGAS